MKKLLATFLFAFVTGTSAVTFAAPTTTDKTPTDTVSAPSITFAQIVKSKLDVTIENSAGVPMYIQLFDSAGLNIATKTIRKSQSAARLRFNLVNLKDGVYYVKATTGKNTLEKKFELKTAVPTPASYQDLTLL